jgi:hypothetical protein
LTKKLREGARASSNVGAKKKNEAKLKTKGQKEIRFERKKGEEGESKKARGKKKGGATEKFGSRGKGKKEDRRYWFKPCR